MNSKFVTEIKPLTKFIMPCKYGITCHGHNCLYWHYDSIKNLCPYGAQCNKKDRCWGSHEKPKFCNQSDCNLSGCTYTHPCKYGIKCNNIQTCKYDHPVEGNRDAFGKGNLLYASSKCLSKLDRKFFDLHICYGPHLNDFNWSDVFQSTTLFELNWKTEASAYVFGPNQSSLN